MNVSGKARAEFLLPMLLGTLAFLIVLGPRVLNPTNVAWLGQGDPATHYLGWLFFRNSAWSFPIGLNPTYGLEISNAVLFSDSNPLLAFIFKPLAKALSQPFQYFGIWLLLCFLLQAWFGWKLIGLVSNSISTRILATGLFVFAPPMLYRVQGHLSLAGHFLILAALYFSFHPKLERRRLAWGTLLVVSALVHAYLLAMVALLWLADLVGKAFKTEVSVRAALTELAVMGSIIGLACWQAGYFSVGPGTSSEGFGFFRMNLLSIFDASGWSHVMPDLPESGGDHEGFNFLGLGIILLGMCALPSVIAGTSGLGGAVRRFPCLCLALAGLAIFAASNKVGLGLFMHEYPLPSQIVEFANIFRASGRMFWPVFYTLLFAAIVIVAKRNNSRVSTVLFGLALLIQVADSSAGWTRIRKEAMTEPSPAWALPLTPLVSEFWTHAAVRYEKVRAIQPGNQLPRWLTVATYAGKHGLATDAVYLARVGSSAMENAQRKASDAVKTGRYETEALYILDDWALRQAVLSVDRATDLLARIDGFNVIAPGWKKCRTCPQVANELKLQDVLPIRMADERVLFGQANSGALHLWAGWSAPEAWGTWSEGVHAELIVPVSFKVRSLQLEADALVSAGYPKQVLTVRINNSLALTTALTSPSGNLVHIPVPEDAQKKISEQGFLRLQFELPNATQPNAIGINSDDRILAIGLRAITLH